MVYKIVFEEPIQQYILAVDNGNVTQKDLLEALVLGKTKKIQQVEILDVYQEEWSDFLNMDLKMRPSKLFFEKNFHWTAKEGFCKNISKVLSEFSLFRGFQSIKVSIIGPPRSGKTYLAK